jgi:hypothetical protein
LEHSLKSAEFLQNLGVTLMQFFSSFDVVAGYVLLHYFDSLVEVQVWTLFVDEGGDFNDHQVPALYLADEATPHSILQLYLHHIFAPLLLEAID